MHAMLNFPASRMSNLLHLGSVRRLLSANSRGLRMGARKRSRVAIR